jgi:hypothetical protein
MSAYAERMRRRIAITLAAAFLFMSSGCASKRDGSAGQGSLVSTNVPLASYVKMGLNASVGEGARFFFPQLQVYDESGNLIYSSHEVFENLKVLEELPGGIRSLQPKPGAPHLADIMELVPVFRTRKQELLAQHRISVLSIFLQDCEACTAQEDALSDAQHRLLDRGVNLLVINLSRPGADANAPKAAGAPPPGGG